MSSIFGVVDLEAPPQHELCDAMFESLSTRGGDTKGWYTADGAVIGCRSDGGRTSAVVKSPSGKIAAAIEGEIYNVDELQRLLGSTVPISSSDSVFQIIPLLYEKFGKLFPKHLNGIFTIALWDEAQKILLLARDHLGSRSLFYARKKDTLCFASTARALLQAGFVKPEVSPPALNAYFSSTAICPPDTLLKDILCLRPGSVVTFQDGRLTDEDYWSIGRVREDRNRSLDDFAQEVRELLLDAIAIRARRDGVYGSLLSGGVDSSIVAATLTGLHHGDKLPVFSITFEEILYNDADLQAVMCRDYSLASNMAVLGAKEFWEILPKAVSHLDSPVNDVACVGMFKAFQMAREVGCPAVFEGEAADELFYTGHAHAEREFQRFAAIPEKIRNVLFGTLFKTKPTGEDLKAKIGRLLWRIGLLDNERRMTGLPSFYKHATDILLDQNIARSGDPFVHGKKYLAETALSDPLNIYYYGLLKTFLPDDLLFKNERMSSANGVVNVTPFIDRRLVELAFAIPQQLKIQPPTNTDDGTKIVYKKAIEGLIPNAILTRKKARGFSQPSSIWYREKLKNDVEDALFSADSRCSSYLNGKYMRKVFSDHVSGMANNDYLLNSLLIFEFWLRNLPR